jgi:hypothetical protein
MTAAAHRCVVTLHYPLGTPSPASDSSACSPHCCCRQQGTITNACSIHLVQLLLWTASDGPRTKEAYAKKAFRATAGGIGTAFRTIGRSSGPKISVSISPQPRGTRSYCNNNLLNDVQILAAAEVDSLLDATTSALTPLRAL